MGCTQELSKNSEKCYLENWIPVGQAHNGTVLSLKKEQTWVICRDVDEPRVGHTR